MAGSKSFFARWVSNNLYYYTAAGLEIFHIDGANRKIVIPAGATFDASAASGQAVPVRTNNEDTYSLAAAQSGLVYVGTKSSSTQVISLPAPTTAGLTFTFVCGNAGGEINVDPGASGITIKGSGISVASTKDLKNTAASNVLGDSVTMVSDGVDNWWITAIQGTWATT